MNKTRNLLFTYLLYIYKTRRERKEREREMQKNEREKTRWLTTREIKEKEKLKTNEPCLSFVVLDYSICIFVARISPVDVV